MGIISEIVGVSFDGCKAIGQDRTIISAPISAGLQRTTRCFRIAVHIATGIGIYLTAGTAINDTPFCLDQAIDRLAVFIAVIQLTLIFKEAVAQARHHAGFFIKVIPGQVPDIIRYGIRIAICHIAVHIQPVGAFLQSHKPAEPALTGNEVLGTGTVGPESTPNHLALVIERIAQALDRFDTGIHFIRIGIKIVEPLFPIFVLNGTPTREHLTKD